jgi:hypothetical protein
MITILEQIARDEGTNATARVSAVRALRELEAESKLPDQLGDFARLYRVEGSDRDS